jgi:putative transposase
MARGLRPSGAGIIYHVLNRGNARGTLFHKDRDAAAFVQLLREVRQAVPMRVLGYCLMGNHWHLVLWPRGEGDLSRFMHRLTVTHVRRWFEHYHDDAGGHLYQGRFKSFAVQDDQHLLTVLRYVEANPLRAKLVERAEDWRWSSLREYLYGAGAPKLLDEWPIQRPPDWVSIVNHPLGETELAAMRTCVARGRPFGQAGWVQQLCRALGLEFTLRNRGRPRKTQTRTDERGAESDGVASGN